MERAITAAKFFLSKVEDAKISLPVWFLGFSGIMLVRTIVKTFIVGRDLSLLGPPVDYLHELFFFSISFLLLWLVLSVILRQNPRNFSGLFFWAAWLIIFPPLIDMIKTGGSIFWSFYLIGTKQELWREFITFFGNLPSGIVYFGTRIVCFTALLLVASVIYIRSKNAIKALVGWFVSYSLLFLMGAFPTVVAFWAYLLDPAKKVNEINAVNIMQMTGAPAAIFGTAFNDFQYAMAYNLNLIFYPLLLGLLIVLFFAIDRNKIFAIAKNSRVPQLVYHTGLFGIGLGLGYLAYPQNFNLNIFSAFAVVDLLIAIWLSWIASVIVNDIYDFQVDAVSNPNRPLPQNVFSVREYAELGAVIFFLALLGGLVVGFKFAALLLTYQFLAWAYSARPYRLKRFPGIATLVSACASLIILFIGFTLFSGDQNLQGLSWRIIFLLLISLTLSLPIKDFKDTEGDKKDGIWTIPVLFGEERGRLIVAVGVFISFMLSVFLLNEFRLFWWAVVFGGATFLIITSPKTKTRQLIWRVLFPVATYGLVLVSILFL